MNVQDEERYESRCVFRNILHTCRRRRDSEFRETNVRSLKEATGKHKDNFCNGLLKDTSKLTAHEKYNLKYKSSDHIRWHLKRSLASANKYHWSSVAIKCTRRSHSAIHWIHWIIWETWIHFLKSLPKRQARLLLGVAVPRILWTRLK